MPVSVRARRAGVALVAAFLGLFFTAGPAAAATVQVGIRNGGTDPVLVKVSGPPGLNLNIKPGCGPEPLTVTPEVAFAVCLPGGAVLALAVNVPES